MRWPAHGTTVRLSAKHADRLQTAFDKCFDADAIAKAWQETHPTPTEVTPQQARDWAKVHITLNTKPLMDVLPQLYADGYVTGETAGAYMLAHLTQNKASATSTVTNWDTWKPGSQAASALLKPKGGLQSLLDTRGITIEGITNTKIDRIGTVLAKAVAQGITPTAVAPLVDKVVNDPQQALVIAQTEMSRAVSVASRQLYQDSNVQQVEWLVAEGCEDCQDNADASPISIDDTFPSGDTEPPAHPNCMCSLAPYSDISLSNEPDLVKFVPSEHEVERALSRLKILPNPVGGDDKRVESPWERVDPITVNPNVWDSAELALVNLSDLVGTDESMSRKNVKKHIKAMGQAITQYRSYALVVQRGDQQIIIDGHHRLFAHWLLGNETAPVWLAKETN